MSNMLKKLLGFQQSHFDMVYKQFKNEGFSLRQDSGSSRQDADASVDDASSEGEQATEDDKKESQKDSQQHEPAAVEQNHAGGPVELRKPIKIKDWKEHKGEPEHSTKKEQDTSQDTSENKDDRTYIDTDLKTNRAYLEKKFGLPANADIIIRDFTIATHPETKALVVYLEGLSDKTVINDSILKSLMQLTALHPTSNTGDRAELVKETLLPGNQVMTYEKWEDVIKNVLMGSSALLIEGSNKALVIETKGWQQRSVSEPNSEKVIRGPHDSFTENLRTNTALIRLRLQTNALITEMLQVGKRSGTTVAIMYLKGVVNPKLVKEVKKRIKKLDTDMILDSGMIEQLIEDRPGSMIPTLLSTERPDRASAFIAEGHVVIIINNSPYVLIAPVSLWAMLHTAEDAYLRWPFGTFLRIIRFLSMVCAMLLPGIYIAVTNYHAEMIPTELMIAIAASRENVPFPVVLEVLLMEFAIELIREAGIRIPSVIGPTIGIVGALILGQAAVQAGIVSPLLVIVVAVTALASFTVPNYNLSFGVRIVRFLFLIAGAIYGFFGIGLLVIVGITYLAGIKSFGVPVLAPVAPFSRSHDVLIRKKLFELEERPTYMSPLDKRKQEPLQRPWSLQSETTEEHQSGGVNSDERSKRDDS
ncbi:spore germination protein [Fodinisporobacter ferrooxydans]|uniref:Spore germination protein n=1 Tax=Fodinisporobacter ferrooxydans TaxID=2901836 RepID=A0ABY4CNR7_9BACL|nr:spore germination protein [Alicyclobacillaceae bacterium MYW30-H2]